MRKLDLNSYVKVKLNKNGYQQLLDMGIAMGGGALTN